MTIHHPERYHSHKPNKAGGDFSNRLWTICDGDSPVLHALTEDIARRVVVMLNDIDAAQGGEGGVIPRRALEERP